MTVRAVARERPPLSSAQLGVGQQCTRGREHRRDPPEQCTGGKGAVQRGRNSSQGRREKYMG